MRSTTREQPADFDVGALYSALDARRQSRGMSWREVAQEISRAFERSPARPISPSTLVGMRKREAVEADGVLQMLGWLHRVAESFVPGYQEVAPEDATLPRVDPHQIVRFDTKAMHSALDARRIERAMSWKQVASEIGGVSPASLTRLTKGGRVAFPPVMRIARWLGRPAASLTRISDR